MTDFTMPLLGLGDDECVGMGGTEYYCRIPNGHTMLVAVYRNHGIHVAVCRNVGKDYPDHGNVQADWIWGDMIHHQQADELIQAVAIAHGFIAKVKACS